jgi:hypothetical protein
MAKIRLDLSQFKASGVYTIEYDQSESIVLNTQTTRLVVGFSKKGPINAPVFCQDVKTAKRIFGEIDTTLEARGSFFHRSLFTCLETGPCFALALMPLNDDETTSNPDLSVFKSFSLSTTEANGATVSKLYSSYFNKERFYFPDTQYFLANVENSINEGKLLSFVNLGQTPFSVIVRKTGDLTGFNVTARDWYGAANVPSYIKPFDYISEYFIQVDIVQGDWTNLTQLSTDPVFSQYFDSKGLKQDKIQAFLNSPDVRTIGSFQGCLIPDLIDGNGTNYSIDTIINNNVATTGLFVALNRKALDDYDPTDLTSAGRVDMVGHTLISNPSLSTIDFLSYNFAAKESFAYPEVASFTDVIVDFGASAPSDLPGATGYSDAAQGWNTGGTGAAYFKSFYGSGNEGKFNNLLYIKKDLLSTVQQAQVESLVVGSSLMTNDSTALGATDSFATVSSFDEGTDNGSAVYIIGISHPLKATEGTSGKNGSILGATAGGFTIGGTAASTDINVGDWILTDNNGVRYYWRVAAIGTTGGNSIVTPDTLSITENGAPNTVLTTFFTAYWESTSGVAGSLYDVIDAFSTSGSAPFTFIASPDVLTYQTSTMNYYEAFEDSELYQDFVTGVLSAGDKVYVGAGPQALYLSPSFVRNSYNIPTLQVKAYIDSALQIGYTGSWNFTDIKTQGGTASYPANNLMIYSLVGDYASSVGITGINANHTKAYVAAANESLVQVGQYLVADPTESGDDTQYVLTRIISKKKMPLGNAWYGYYEIAVNQPLANFSNYSEVKRYKKVQEAAPAVQFSYFSGFKIGAYHLPGTKAQLAKILGLLDEANSNISTGLIDRNIIGFRYIVDTFNGGLDTQSYPKNLLSKLAMRRQQCMAIINTPSIQEFIDSTDPRFTDTPTNANPKPVLKAQYIAEGGNLALGPSFVYSLPDEENGAKFAGFFAPYLVIRDNNKNIIVPPAADVSNNFIRKFLSGQPYSIVAGPRRGVLSNPRLVALEYDFTDTDREYLEPFGWNPIVYRNNSGFQIYGNQTAYQKTLTAYNNLHVRDLLITVEEAIIDVLSNYVFEFNDATTRLEIKSIVDKFLDNVRSAGGIYDYRTIMDSSNNTAEIIDQNFAIIDVGIEPARGAQKFINRITVLKTGQISSGGFSVA